MNFEQEKTKFEYNFVFTLWKYPKSYIRYAKKIAKLTTFFTNKDVKFFYILGRQMVFAGFNDLDQVSVLSYVSKNEKIKNAFEQKGGYDTFELIKPELSENNLEGYFNEILKINCLTELQDKGFDIEKDYHTLSQMNAEQIRLYYSYKLNNIFLEHSSETKIEQILITDDDLINFNEGFAMGISIAKTAPLLNYEILGINRGLSFLGGTVNSGKSSATLALIIMGWIKDKRKSCIISNEQTIMEFKQMLIGMCSFELFGENDLDRRRIKIGKFNQDEWDKLKEIQEYFNKTYAPYLSFNKIFEYSLEDVQRTIEVMSAKGYEGFVYDVFKADDRTNGRVVDEMVEMSKSLFKTADNNNVSIIATIQLGLGYNDVRYLTMTTISTSKHIVEPATEVLLIRDMWEDEVTGGKNDIKIYNYAYNAQGQKILDGNGKPVKKFYEILGEDYKEIKLMFLAKTRNSKRGVVLAYRFNGDFNQWVELGYCNPSYENRNSKK